MGKRISFRRNKKLNDGQGHTGHQQGSNPGADVERFLGAAIFGSPHEEGTDDGADDADSGKGDGQQAGAEFGGIIGQFDGTDDHGSHDTTDVGFEEVGTHASDVADVVTDVVGDGGGVTGVVFGDTGFEFTDEVGTDVGGFGVNATAHTGEQRDGGGAHGETGNDANDLHGGGIAQEVEAVLGVHEHQEAETGNAETDNAHPHDGTTAKSNGQCLVEAGPGGVGGAHVGGSGHPHTEEAGEGGAGGTQRRS